MTSSLCLNLGKEILTWTITQINRSKKSVHEKKQQKNTKKMRKELFFCLLIAAAVTAYHEQSILIENIQTLTLSSFQDTHRHRSHMPQLKCIKGPCHEFQPSIVQCTNKGHDGLNVQWRCEAEMPSQYAFGELKVRCEGFSGPGDRYVLAGSCGLEYELKRVSSGATTTTTTTTTHQNHHYPSSYNDQVASYFIMLCFLMVFMLIVGYMIVVVASAFIDFCTTSFDWILGGRRYPPTAPQPIYTQPPQPVYVHTSPAQHVMSTPVVVHHNNNPGFVRFRDPAPAYTTTTTTSSAPQGTVQRTGYASTTTSD